MAAVSTLARLLAYVGSIVALPKLRKRAGKPSVNAAIIVAGPIALVLCIWATTQTNALQWQTLGGFALFGTMNSV